MSAVTGAARRASAPSSRLRPAARTPKTAPLSGRTTTTASSSPSGPADPPNDRGPRLAPRPSSLTPLRERLHEPALDEEGDHAHQRSEESPFQAPPHGPTLQRQPARPAQVDPGPLAAADDREQDVPAVAAAHDRARAVEVDVDPRELLLGAADVAHARRGGEIDAEQLEQLPADRVPVERAVAGPHPVAPKRSVLIQRGS